MIEDVLAEFLDEQVAQRIVQILAQACPHRFQIRRSGGYCCCGKARSGISLGVVAADVPTAEVVADFVSQRIRDAILKTAAGQR